MLYVMSLLPIKKFFFKSYVILDMLSNQSLVFLQGSSPILSTQITMNWNEIMVRSIWAEHQAHEGDRTAWGTDDEQANEKTLGTLEEKEEAAKKIWGKGCWRHRRPEERSRAPELGPCPRAGHSRSGW